jgi:hypothetical protein
MKDGFVSESDAGAGEAAGLRSYETPVLTRYGLVEELTQGAAIISRNINDLLSIPT